MKKIKKNKKVILVILSIFVGWIILSSFIPLTGDDWQNYGNGSFNIINILRRTKHYYFLQEGRLCSRLLIFILTVKKWLWSIISSLALVIILAFGQKIVNNKNKIFMICVLLLSIFLINYSTFTQCFFWIAGNVTYVISASLFIIYIYYLLKTINNKKKSSIFEIIFFSIYNIAICLFVENLAVGVLISNILVLIYSYFISKKKEKKFCLYTIFSIIGLLILTLGPGTAKRISSESGALLQMNFFEKIIYNIPNFVKYTYLNNPFLVLLLSISVILLIKKYQKNKKLKIFLYLFVSIIPFLTVLSNLNLLFPIEINLLNSINESLTVLNNSNILICIYWLIFTLIYILGIILYVKDSKQKYKILFTTLIGFSCMGAMLITPTWSSRVTFTTIILLYISCYSIFNYLNIKVNKVCKIIIYIMTVLYFMFIIFIYYNVNKCINYRDSYIINQYKQEKTNIDYLMVPDRLLVSQYPYSNGYKNAFNIIMHIDGNVKYKSVYCGYKYQIIFDKNEVEKCEKR